MFSKCVAKIAIFSYFRAIMMDKVKEIFEGLNEEQTKAVNCIEGPELIVAGAGSGKTRVLTSRIAYILASGLDPSRVMALTFTKKAAGEMKERIALMVGDRSARRVVMGTFHSVFIRFLREYADSLGYSERFTISDQSDSVSAVKSCIKELGLDDEAYKPKVVQSRISMVKNNLVTVAAYKSSRELLDADSRTKRPRIVDIYERYQAKLKQAGVMDFDDILLNMNYLLLDKEALKSIATRFDYIMVDEYQDTNYAQYLILRKLSQGHRNICVVGDDSQSIYAFRGAKIENILNFKKDFPECKIFRLERNYRSTKTIVEAANSLIAHNDARIPKECYAMGENGELIRLIKAYNEQEEALQIVSEIKSKMRSERAMYQDFAILYRTNAQSRALEEQLRRFNIPYMIYSGNSFFDRAEVRDMMAYFKLCVNPFDDESFKRVVNKPARGIGDTTLKSLAALAAERGSALFKAGMDVPKVRPFCEMINRLASEVKGSDAHDLALKIADESGLYAFYKADNSLEGLSRTANVEELINSVASFVEDRKDEADGYTEDRAEDGTAEPAGEPVFTLDDFLENVSLLSNVDVSDDEDTNNKVALMTVHSAKGLEFPYVFVAGMEENLFPSLNMLSSAKDLEEERRLFYVAITRAKKAVELSFADTRMRNGKHESNAPSRFLKEIDSRYMENPLTEEDFDNSGVTHEWGGFGSRFSGGRIGGSASAYGRSSGVTYSRRSQIPGPISYHASSRSGAPSSGRSGDSPVIHGTPILSAPKPKLIDKDFVGVPASQLFEGERIEHNRFGAGKIISLSGKAPDLKARIVFDDYGEKLLLLRYAQLRPAKN